ncbi:hypothetical protein ACRQ5D_24240 [Mucilaginibacter sp. P25]|uniref:Nucleotide-binding universal stress protein, UspA family n=1 Tax=Mucilaginibacter gossypii TaxID=551996 RepID=A0A1G7TYT4_9SPHI|nr:universal stress protein [Mucilaginibacter gossypii]SDG40416.1 Nucleotide-binding universal stress protein, UspA family [Mucilaginibacter gossypii]
MKKIMLALNAEKPDPQSVAFGVYLARLTGSQLCGIFLEDQTPTHEAGVKFAYGSVYVETIDADEEPIKAFKEKAAQLNIRVFKEACEAQGINCRVHRDQGVPQTELINESRYADVLVSGPVLFASSALEMPAGFVKTLLAKSECPVIIAPHHTHPINKILFAFNGSASALFAIKQFTYLFPELKDTELVVMQVDEDAVFNEEQKEKLYEYLRVHYRLINFKDLRGKPKDELFDYSLRENNACLVMGAYGRNWLSKFFKDSTAELIIKLNNLPVFITHW